MLYKAIKILAVDDNKDNLISLNAVIAEILPHARLFTALNGVDGIKLAEAENPDVILLDIVMPGMNGFEVCTKLKEDENLKHIPVVFLTAMRTDQESRINALNAGAEAFVSKPFEFAELLAQINAMVKIKRANEAQIKEKERLAHLVSEKTEQLEIELAERKQIEAALRMANETLLQNQKAMLNLLEDLKTENNARRESEEIIRVSEGKYRSIFDNSPIAVEFYDSEGNYIDANKAALSMFGIENMGSIKGFNFFDSSHVFADIKEKCKNGISVRYEKWIDFIKVKEDKLYNTSRSDKLCLDTDITPIMVDNERKPIAFVVQIQDITERKNAENKLIESETRYRSIFNDSPLAIWEEDFSEVKKRFDKLAAEGIADVRKYFEEHPEKVKEFASLVKIKEVNKASLEVVGVENNDEMPNTLGTFFNGFSLDVFKEELVSLSNGNLTFISEIPVLKNTKEEAVLNLHLAVQPGSEDTLSSVLVSFEDITERKNAEKFLALLYDLALKLGQKENLKEILDLILTTVMEVSGMNSGGIYLVDKDTGALTLEVHDGLSEEFITSTQYFAPDSENTLLVMKGEPTYTLYNKLSKDGLKSNEKLRGIAIVPITYKDNIIGCINLASNKLDELLPSKRKMVEIIAAQLGGFIQRAMLHNSLLKDEEELKLLNKRFETMINVSPLAIITLDKNDKVQMWNKAAEKIFGYSAEEIIGKVNPLVPDEHSRDYENFSDRIYKGGPILNEETYRKRKDGTLVPISISGAPFFDSKGEFSGRMAIFTDITERKRNERVMAARYNLISSAQTQSIDKFLSATLDEIEKLTGSNIGFYHFVNDDQKTLSLQNWSTNTVNKMFAEQGIGMHYDIDAAGVWGDCINSGKPVIHNNYPDLSHKKGIPEGHASLIREAVVPIFRGDKIVAVIGVGNKENDYDENDVDIIWQMGDLSWDIIDKKKTEEEVLSQKNLLGSIFESSPYIIALVDKNGVVSAINKEGEKFAQKDKDDIFNKLGGEVFNCINSFSQGGCGKNPNCDSCLIRNTLNATLLGKSSNLNVEGKMIFIVDGEPQAFNLLVSATPVRQKNEDYVLITLVDITARKNAEDAVLKSEKRLKRAQYISQIGNWELDLKNGKLWASDEAFKVYGIERITSELSLEQVQTCVLPQFRPLLNDTLTSLVSGIGEYNVEFQIKRQADGEIRYVHSIAELAFNDNGEKLAVNGVLQDVTERMTILEELKESEERYRQLVELSPDAILIHQNGIIVYVNSAALKLFGAANLTDIINTRLIDRVHPDYKNIVTKRIDKINTSSASVPQIEEKILRFDGRAVDVEVSAAHFYYKGAPAVQVIARDITERRIFIDSLRLSEERFRNISSTISDLAYSCINEGKGNYKLNWITGAAQNVTGYSNDEILEKTCWSFLVIKEDLKIFEKNVVGLKPGETAQTELRIRKKNGDQAWVLSFAECAEDKSSPGGHILYGGLVNITERKLFEAALQESEERFRTLIENAPDGIEVLDLDGNYLEVNSAACAQLGYSREELSRMKIFDIDPYLTSENYNKVIESLRKGLPMYLEVIHRNKNGTLFPAEITSGLLRIAGNESVLTIVRDITDRKKAERELDLYRNHLEELVRERTIEIAKINAKLIEEIEKEKEIEIILRDSLDKEKELNELKSRFISTASHEFKTPLTTILSSVELIQRYGKTWEDEKREKHIDRIQTSVDHLSKLIDEVLTISRSESGKMQNNPENLDLMELCSKFIDEVKPKLLDTHKLNFKFNSKRKDFSLDPKLMRHIVINLLTNAIKYSPSGGKIDLNITVLDGALNFTVRDEGIGFNADDEKRLFEPFFRGKNALDYEGTGLGLSIVKRAVDVMNGSISFRSKLGKGTIVEIKIPRS